MKRTDSLYVSVFPLGSKISVKDFNKAIKSCNTKQGVQLYLNKLLLPSYGRISLEELSYALAFSHGDTKKVVKILNDFLSMLPSARLKRIWESLEALGEDLPESFTRDYLKLIQFFELIKFNTKLNP